MYIIEEYYNNQFNELARVYKHECLYEKLSSLTFIPNYTIIRECNNYTQKIWRPKKTVDGWKLAKNRRTSHHYKLRRK